MDDLSLSFSSRGCNIYVRFLPTTGHKNRSGRNECVTQGNGQTAVGVSPHGSVCTERKHLAVHSFTLVVQELLRKGVIVRARYFNVFPP